jgi:hypothetical protein
MELEHEEMLADSLTLGRTAMAVHAEAEQRAAVGEERDGTVEEEREPQGTGDGDRDAPSPTSRSYGAGAHILFPSTPPLPAALAPLGNQSASSSSQCPGRMGEGRPLARYIWPFNLAPRSRFGHPAFRNIVPFH